MDMGLQGAPLRRSQGVRPAEPLTRELIVATAARLVETDGAESLTLRRVARELDVSNSALAWHIGDRRRLLALVGADWLSSVAAPPADVDWVEWLACVAQAYRCAAHARPYLARLAIDAFAVLPVADTGALPHAVLSGLAAAGLDPERISDVYNVTLAAVVGFVALELATGDAVALGLASADQIAPGPPRFGVSQAVSAFDDSFSSLLALLRAALRRLDDEQPAAT
jgi:TetR/AcrR family tetracycline transcriptional repressor